LYSGLPADKAGISQWRRVEDLFDSDAHLSRMRIVHALFSCVVSTRYWYQVQYGKFCS